MSELAAPGRPAAPGAASGAAPGEGAQAAPPVLIVDDEAELRRSLGQWLALGGFEPRPHASATAALEALSAGFPGCIISDVRMPGMDGLALMEAVAARDPSLPVILLTGHGDVPMAVAAMRAGAYDFVEKPFDPDRLLALVGRAVAARALALENRALRRRLGAAGSGVGPDRLLGDSAPMRRLREALEEAALSRAPVLVTGETGSGKELIARSLHEASPRADGPFLAINCAAVPETLFEAAFFGHEAGAFTGAGRARAGYLESASGGTLFLDEVTALPAHLQPVLLRALQEGEVQRLGARRPVRVDTRVIAATNADIDAEIAAGRLRPDFVYRLNTLSLCAPPLRERLDDIPVLFAAFVAATAEREGRPDLAEQLALSPGDLAALRAHRWPGNVRELANLAERWVVRGRRRPVAVAALLDGAQEAGAADTSGEGGLRERMEAYERALLEEALRTHEGNVAAVMEALALPRRTLNEKLARHGLSARDFKPG